MKKSIVVAIALLAAVLTSPLAHAQYTAADREELSKANPDWSKVGTQLSGKCIKEFDDHRISPECQLEGEKWMAGVKAKMEDPRFLKFLEKFYND